MATHKLKTEPQYFEAALDGSKSFEVRREDDKRFAVGDTLILQEYVPFATHAFTGRSLAAEVTFVLRGAPYVPEGYAVLGMRPAHAPRPVVSCCAMQKEAQLRANDHKGDWAHEDFWRLVACRVQEVHESLACLMDYEHNRENADAVIGKCADIANFALMIADRVRKEGDAHESAH